MVPSRRILPGCVGHAPIAFVRSVFSVAAPFLKRSPASAQAAQASIDCRIGQYGGRKVVLAGHGVLWLRVSPRLPPGARWRLRYACLLPMQAASGNERTGSTTDAAVADCRLVATQATRPQAVAMSTQPRSPGFHRGLPGWCLRYACFPPMQAASGNERTGSTIDAALADCRLVATQVTRFQAAATSTQPRSPGFHRRGWVVSALCVLLAHASRERERADRQHHWRRGSRLPLRSNANDASAGSRHVNATAIPRFPPGASWVVSALCVPPTHASREWKRADGQHYWRRVRRLPPRSNAGDTSAGRRHVNATAIPRFPPGAVLTAGLATASGITIDRTPPTSHMCFQEAPGASPGIGDADPPVSTGGFLGGVRATRAAPSSPADTVLVWY
jgi:hypothetical protein